MRISLYIYRAIALGVLCIPHTALSAESVVIDDSIAGLGTQIMIHHASYDGSERISVIDPNGQERTYNVQEDTILLRGDQTQTSGTYEARLIENDQIVARDTALILPDRIDVHVSSITTERLSLHPDGQDEVRITITAHDRYANPLSDRPIELISNRPEDEIRFVSAQTNTQGKQEFILSTHTPGSITLRAIDLLSGELLDESIDLIAGAHTTSTAYGGPTPYASQPMYYPTPAYAGQQHPSYPVPMPRGASMFYAQIAPQFEVIDHFEISAPANLAAGVEAQKIVIRAVDQNGMTVEDYVGNVVFSSTDPHAVLPAFGQYTFRERDLGQREFPLALKFQTPGEQMFRVEDQSNKNIFGQISINITGDGGIPSDRLIKITSHKDKQKINTTTITLEGKGPPFINLLATGGDADQTGETGAEGSFSIPISLNPEQRDFTIRVRDDRGHYDSGSLHLILDQIPPPIDSITFTPEKPGEGENVLWVVESEPELAKVLLVMDTEESRPIEQHLEPNESASGTYQLLTIAPTVGRYQPVIRAIDQAGNVTDIRTQFEVLPPLVPKVQNVRATPETNAITLEWDPVDMEVDQYRIYVGEDPENFLYNLDTGQPTTKATVNGLLPGHEYVFALTALKENLESSQKSDVVRARVLGLTLSVTPQDASLLVEWSSPPIEATIESYLLEYGIEPGVYTEQRKIHGDANAYTLRDLLNDITYYVRLTPVTVTGEILTDLAVTGQGTPEALIAGFRPGPSEPIPFEPHRPPIGSVTSPPPALDPSGLPPIVWWLTGVVTLIVGGFYILRRRRVQRETAFLRDIQRRYI
jgi:hypothetical protein